MGKLLFFFWMLLAVQCLSAQQVIENPSFQAREGSILTIRRIERTEQDTKLHCQVVFRPEWWITCDSTIYLEDVASGKKYYPTAIEGTKFNERIFLPKSGEMDIVLTYPPLPQETTLLNWINPNGKEHNTYGISLSRQSKKETLLSQLRGNWITQDNRNEWILGLYDSLAIYKNRFWKYADMRKKGKRILLTLQNETGSTQLSITLQKGDLALIACDDAKAVLCGRKETPNTQYADVHLTENVLRTDTACIQGYLDGYDPRFSYSTGIIYLSNDLTGEDYPTVVTIQPDGRFNCKFVLHHPVKKGIYLNNCDIPFYIEPGQTLTLYLNNEALLEYSRARGLLPSPQGITYMGEAAAVSRLQTQLRRQFSWNYDELRKDQRLLTPAQYAEKKAPLLAIWKAKADSIAKVGNCSPSLTKAIYHKAVMAYVVGMLDFSSMRGYYASQDTTNQVLKVAAGDDYFKFLKELPLDSESLLIETSFGTFINRYEFCEFLKTYPSWRSSEELYSHLIKSDWANNDKMKHFLGIGHIPFIQQVALVRASRYRMNSLNDKALAEKYVQELNQCITLPKLRADVEFIFRSLYDDVYGSYELPSGKATDIFRKIADKHKGKYVLVDFWSTGCGPCRSGIERSLALREKLRDSKDVDFIFITSEDESFEPGYGAYVEKNLKGEACYRIPTADYHYLRQLFRFNGIPYYKTLNREGKVLRKGLSYESLEVRLKELLDAEIQ